MLHSSIGKNALLAPFDSDIGGGSQIDSIRKLKPSDIQFGNDHSTKVISCAQKFIIPVPAYGPEGEPLVYPAGHESAGQPILNYKGQAVGDYGVVFFNRKDRCWQAVPGDGSAVIIMNEVAPMQAELLFEKYKQKLSGTEEISLSDLKDLLEYASTNLYLDDIYCSTKEFIRTRMTPVTQNLIYTREGDLYGFMKRDDRDVCEAVYIPGQFSFDGPAATPQLFDEGGVIVKQGSSIHGVQPNIFARTYRLLNGKEITDTQNEIVNQ